MSQNYLTEGGKIHYNFRVKIDTNSCKLIEPTASQKYSQISICIEYSNSCRTKSNNLK